MYPAPAEGLAVAKLIAGESQCKLCGKKLGGNVAPWRWVYGHWALKGHHIRRWSGRPHSRRDVGGGRER